MFLHDDSISALYDKASWKQLPSELDWDSLKQLPPDVDWDKF